MIDPLVQVRVLSATPAEIWPILSNTAELNFKLGLAPMKFEVIDGVRHGQQKVLGMNTYWTEKPWEWKQDSWLKNERVFSKGLFAKIEGIFEIKPVDETRSEVFITFIMHHKYRLLRSLFNHATKGIISKLFDAIETELKRPKHKIESSDADDFETWLEQARPFERERLIPKRIAQDTKSDWVNIMQTALDDNFQKRFSLRFDAVCPHCRGAKQTAPRLTELAQHAHCDTCAIEFEIGSQESIEVTLLDTSLPPDQRGFDFCSADVANKPTVVFQRLGGQWHDSLELKQGIFNLKKRGVPEHIKLVVDPAIERSSVDLDAVFQQGHERLKTGRLVEFKTAASSPSDHFMLEQLSKFNDTLSAAELMLQPGFEALVPLESIVTDFPIEMGNKALLFTDVVGSTDLYFTVGDQLAFKKVRDSFLIIGEVTKKHHGILVKTIGDATMYAFNSGEDALKAAIAIQEANRGNDMKLRISLHYGPCLTVVTQDGQDFFGDTVNICAKFQSEVDADELIFENSLCNYISRDFLTSIEKKFEEVDYSLKGAHKRSFKLQRMRIS